jgi:hypothetical protein
VFENVASMSRNDREVITDVLGVEPVCLNSNLKTAQNRRRLYWCNFPVSPPEDDGVMIADRIPGATIVAMRGRYRKGEEENTRKRKRSRTTERPKTVQNAEPRTDGRSNTLTSVKKDNLVRTERGLRNLTAEEYEWLQGVPRWLHRGRSPTPSHCPSWYTCSDR